MANPINLPIAQQSYQPSPDAMVRAVKRAQAILARTAATETPLTGAAAITCPSRRAVRFVNYAADLHLPKGTTAQTVIGELLAHFRQQHTICHAMESAETDWPDALAHQAQQRGFEPKTQHVFQLAGYQPDHPIHADLQIIPARAAYEQLKAFYDAMAANAFRDQPQLKETLTPTLLDRLDEPRLELFVGRLDGQLVGVVGVTTLGQIGVINPAYTDPQRRGQRIATTLLTHTLDHCARAQMEQVLLVRCDGCPSIGFYQSLGFKPIASYIRFVTSHTNPDSPINTHNQPRP